MNSLKSEVTVLFFMAIFITFLNYDPCATYWFQKSWTIYKYSYKNTSDMYGTLFFSKYLFTHYLITSALQGSMRIVVVPILWVTKKEMAQGAWKWKFLSTTLCDPMDNTVHGILQARILEWVAFPFSRGPSQPRDRTQVSRIAGGFFTSWVTREAQE